MNEVQLKRTWAEIDLSALEYNYRRIRQHVGGDKKFLLPGEDLLFLSVICHKDPILSLCSILHFSITNPPK